MLVLCDSTFAHHNYACVHDMVRPEHQISLLYKLQKLSKQQKGVAQQVNIIKRETSVSFATNLFLACKVFSSVVYSHNFYIASPIDRCSYTC